MEKLLLSKSKSDLIRLLIDNTPVAYIILDDKYRIHYINNNFLKLRKLDPDTTIGELCYNISNGGVHCRQCAVERALKTGNKSFISRKDTLPDGSIRFIDDYAIPLYKNEQDGTQYILEIMVNRTQEMLAREQRDADYDEMLAILSKLLEAKDSYTATHSESVRDIACKLAHAMMLPAKEIFDISIGASLHDIGKIHIPDAIINKPDRLNDDEFDAIKKHPVRSFDMLSDLSSFDGIKNIAKHHHERVDGRGYPDRLSGDQISLGAKIVAVADTYDAITSTRSYRKALTHEYALEEIARVAGTQLDEEVVKTFLTMDFGQEKDFARVLDGDAPPVERVIGAQSVKSDTSKIQTGDFKKIVDQDMMLSGIFDNTPCGYVLMDTRRKVIFASKYFLEYMGLSEDAVLDKLCYEAGSIGSKPCENCAIECALESGKVEHMRQEQYTNNGRKIFDLYGMPLVEPDGSIEYVIEVIIDRTEEILLERRREQDFTKLIDMLSSLLEKHTDSSEQKLSNGIVALRKQLNALLSKNKG